MSGARDLVARVLLAALVIVAAARFAARRAPAAAKRTPIPPVSAESAPARDPEVVAVRLTESLGAARVEVPVLTRALEALGAHRRRMVSPWKDTAARAKLVHLVALRTSATDTGQAAGAESAENEGAYAQREAIFAPTPATFTFRLRVPPAAAIEVAPAVVTGPGHADVSFTVRATPVGEPAVVVGRLTLRERERWSEQRFDLSALAGREVDLELVTDSPEPALSFWGTPRIVRRAPSTLPYNVLWIVVDALRPDVIASFRDPAADAAKLAAKHPPLDALLPVVTGLTPAIDALAARSTIFREAISPAPWTRPGTLGMLTGVHARRLGMPPARFRLLEPETDAYYRALPPLFPLAMRRAGAATRAFVNNEFMLGYTTAGVDMGFDHVEHYRYRTADTREITRAAIASLRTHASERFLHFVHYNSPQYPYDPPPECLARIPGLDPKSPAPVMRYMAEACKDDAGIGELLAEVDRLALRDSTVVVLTADHGETLSAAHYHHASGMWEETTRIPLLLSLPGVIPEGKKVDGRVTSLDLAPTLLTLLGLERDPRQTGLDLLAAVRSGKIPERAIVTLGRGTAAIFHGRYRYVLRDKAAETWRVGSGDGEKLPTVAHELYDLVDDPGETYNLALLPSFAAIVAELRARLTAALAGAPTADEPVAGDEPAPKLLVRFAGGGRLVRVHATITAAGAKTITALPFGIANEAIRVVGQTVEVATVTARDGLVGVDLTVAPATAAISWSIGYDDKPLGDDAVFGGVLGVTEKGLSKGILDAAMRTAVTAPRLPFVDPAIDRGVFVVRLAVPGVRDSTQ